MTIGRTYPHENPFLDWIRDVKELDSYDGFRVYDLDAVIWNSNTNRWMFIECKGKDTPLEAVKPHQRKTIEVLGRSLSLNPDIIYVGTLMLSFENKSPADGLTTIYLYNKGGWWKLLAERLNEKEVINFINRCLNGQGTLLQTTGSSFINPSSLR